MLACCFCVHCGDDAQELPCRCIPMKMSRLILIASVPICRHRPRVPGARKIGVAMRRQLGRENDDFSGLHLTARRSFHVTSLHCMPE